MTTLLKGLVNDILTYFEVKIQAKLLDGGESAAEAVELKLIGDKAVEIVTTILCHRRRETPKEEVERIILEHIHQFTSSRGIMEAQLEVHHADDVFELGEVFKLLSTPADADELDTGIVIADTPDIEDMNRYVAANTERYLKHTADLILLIAQYLRLENNVEPLLEKCLQVGKISSTQLVVIKMDQKDLLKKPEIEKLEELLKQKYMAVEAEFKPLYAKLTTQNTGFKKKQQRPKAQAFGPQGSATLQKQCTDAVEHYHDSTEQVRSLGVALHQIVVKSASRKKTEEIQDIMGKVVKPANVREDRSGEDHGDDGEV
ncbi:hypothetical protein DOTSEDRAFT_21779 [Dothistroma septosporum NZE10]|uniref:Uncharacterized protein n=1 Tax=Dothistroma septosporum (strain NZE10 / CBS 128990) TaxID=675120 RepID=N1PX10_DOTSN|nr:hypothetical protein DOTSEDRAFT_21779 [Dothistroma septosporum NZE10]